MEWVKKVRSDRNKLTYKKSYKIIKRTGFMKIHIHDTIWDNLSLLPEKQVMKYMNRRRCLQSNLERSFSTIEFQNGIPARTHKSKVMMSLEDTRSTNTKSGLNMEKYNLIFNPFLIVMFSFMYLLFD